MSNDISNETLPLPSPPQSQKEIIENNNDSLSKTELKMSFNHSKNMVVEVESASTGLHH